MLVGGVWEAGLVFVLVERADPQQASATLRPGHGDGVADAAVGQPAVVAAVQPRPPGREQLTGRRQDGVVLLALLPRLLQGEFIAGRRRIEDLAFRQRTRTEEVNKCQLVTGKALIIQHYILHSWSI